MAILLANAIDESKITSLAGLLGSVDFTRLNRSNESLFSNNCGDVGSNCPPQCSRNTCETHCWCDYECECEGMDCPHYCGPLGTQ